MAETPRKPVDTEADEELVAYLDGELDPREAATMATRIGLDPKLRAKADALQRAWDILDVLPKPQPSPTFVAHTVTQILPIRGPVAATMAALPVARTGRRFWIAAVVAVAAAGPVGYFIHRALAPAHGNTDDEAIARDRDLLTNLRLYRNVDDLDFVKKLDAPDLFGEDE